MQELRKLWKLHAKLLAENRVTKLIDNRKVTKASDLRIGQLVFVKDHCKGTFNPVSTFDHRISTIVNKSTMILSTPERRGVTFTHYTSISIRIISKCFPKVSG